MATSDELLTSLNNISKTLGINISFTNGKTGIVAYIELINDNLKEIKKDLDYLVNINTTLGNLAPLTNLTKLTKLEVLETISYSLGDLVNLNNILDQLVSLNNILDQLKHLAKLNNLDVINSKFDTLSWLSSLSGLSSLSNLAALNSLLTQFTSFNTTMTEYKDLFDEFKKMWKEEGFAESILRLLGQLIKEVRVGANSRIISTANKLVRKLALKTPSP